MPAPSLTTLYARALLVPKRGDGTVPGRRIVLSKAAPDPDRLERYARVCGFERTDRLPATYPHIVAFPLSMALMTERDFPYRVVGLVHLANRIEQVRPIAPGERLTYRVEPTQPAPHAKGITFDILAEAEDESGAVVWRSSSTYLRRGGSGSGPAAVRQDGELKELDPSGPADFSEQWTIPGDIGRRYAAASGDRNPIHLHAVTARLFGFPRAIAHGMWTKARCLAALEDVLPDSFEARVSFRAPVLLPAKATFRASGTDAVRPFDLRGKNGEREHLRGVIEGR